MVGYPHNIKGQGIYAYAALDGREIADRRSAQGTGAVGAHGNLADRGARFAPVRAGPAEDTIRQDHRRILRKIAEDEFGNLGDTSTLADPAVVNDLVDNRQNKRTAWGCISLRTARHGVTVFIGHRVW